MCYSMVNSSHFMVICNFVFFLPTLFHVLVTWRNSKIVVACAGAEVGLENTCILVIYFQKIYQ